MRKLTTTDTCALPLIDSGLLHMEAELKFQMVSTYLSLASPVSTSQI
jgi:hypothetical protein